MSRIVSSVAGRIRVRDKSLRDREKIERLTGELSQIPAISELQSNARTGSVLVYFDRHAIKLSAMEAKIESAVDKVIGKAPKSEALLTIKNVNRYNKILMLASLAASLFALSVARRKRRIRWHKLMGYVFLSNLGVHFYIYRKSLLRLLTF